MNIYLQNPRQDPLLPHLQDIKKLKVYIKTYIQTNKDIEIKHILPTKLQK